MRARDFGLHFVERRLPLVQLVGPPAEDQLAFGERGVALARFVSRGRLLQFGLFVELMALVSQALLVQFEIGLSQIELRRTGVEFGFAGVELGGTALFFERDATRFGFGPMAHLVVVERQPPAFERTHQLPRKLQVSRPPRIEPLRRQTLAMFFGFEANLSLAEVAQALGVFFVVDRGVAGGFVAGRV